MLTTRGRLRRDRLALLAVLALLGGLLTGLPVARAGAGATGPTAQAAPSGVAAWGGDLYGELGDGTQAAPRYNPTARQVPGLRDIIAIAGGGEYTLALRANGTLLAWGDGEYGQLGDRIADRNHVVATPTAIPGVGGVVAIAAGSGFALALKADGTVLAWGNNGNGQLGDGTVGSPENDPTPKPVPGLTNIVYIAAGATNGYAVKGDGTLLVWGNNFHGLFGDGTRNPSTSGGTPTPTVVPGVSGVVAVSITYWHVLVLKSDGTVMSWGYGLYGKLGYDLDATTNNPTPKTIPGISGATAIAAGGYHSLVLRGDGTVLSFGTDSYGELGDGTPGEGGAAELPKPVPGLTGITAIAAAESYSMALKSDGTVWAWGVDDNGQLGDGTQGAPTENATPRAVVGVSGASAIAAGLVHGMALVAPPPPSPAPSFGDVPAGYWAHDQIGAFAQRGITTGCGGTEFCPERGVTRAEMAVFLDRTLGFGSPVAPVSQRFADVPPPYWAYAFIDQFAQLGITTGCGGTEFCPERGVTRAEMAAFLIRALKQNQLTPATPTFADVPTSHPQYGYIEALVALNVTTGCGTDDQGRRVYCPDRGVTRAEMAVFIIRAFP